MSVEQLQNAMQSLPQVDCQVKHHFTDGLYARELIIPAGVCVVGAKHNTNHILMVTQGECLISNNGLSERVTAPYMLETTKGTKRAITAITDTTMITFHVTKEKNVKKIGEAITEKEDKLLPQWKQLEVVK